MAAVDLAKIVNVDELEVATAQEVADTYHSNDDTNQYTDAEVTKLGLCTPTVLITQVEYDALPSPDTTTIYIIRPAV